MYMNENFTTSGRTVKQLGWKELYLQNANKNNLNNSEEANGKEEENSSLPLMKKNDVVDYVDGKYEKKSTKPPTRFTSATLLAGMKEIHKYVKDVEVKKKLKDIYGIGTEATRASIIEDLIKRGFLQTEGKKKYLIPTQTAYMLIDVLPDEMTYPDSTAIWEDYLHSLSEGEGSVEEFLQMQANFTKDLCLKANKTVLVGQNEYKCPRCKRGVLVKRNGKNGTFWGCSNFPTCRMTCNDVDGKPDLKAKTYVSSKYSNVNYSNFYDTLNEVEKTTDSGIISAWDLVLQNKTNPSFNKVKKSAMPLEKQAKQGTKNVDSKYLCPHCKDGSLRRIHGKNGWFWACSNYPHCTATYDDNNGMPMI